MAAKDLELLCVGNALVDVFARADEATCARYGLEKPIQHIEIEKLLALLSELETESSRGNLSPLVVTSGGGAANVAKIAGFLGAKLCFTGAIGADRYGLLFESDLRAACAEPRLLRKNAPTGICVYLETTNETRVAASPSAALELAESDIADEDIKRAGVVVIDGFMLHRKDFVRRILLEADKYETAAALDLSSPSIAGEYAAEIADLARKFRLILFMNEAEAEAFCKGVRNEEFLRSLTAGKAFPIVIVKRGERGAVVFSGGKTHYAETLAVTPVESTGAGDAFAAAFLTAWVRKKPLPECAALGNKAAALVLKVRGTKASGMMFRELAEHM